MQHLDSVDHPAQVRPVDRARGAGHGETLGGDRDEWLSAVGNLVNVLCHAVRYVAVALPSLYDVYISIPLRIERLVRSGDEPERERSESPRRKSKEPVGEAEVV